LATVRKNPVRDERYVTLDSEAQEESTTTGSGGKSCLMSLLALLIGAALFFALGEVLARVLKLDERARLVMINPEAILDFKGLHRISDDPERVYELQPGARLEIDSGSRHAVYSVNSFGLRDEELAEEKASGVFRILVLGDSMTFGPAMNLEETYPKVLEGLLNEQAGGQTQYEVINGAVSGYNSFQELATWRAMQSVLEPDLVIVGICVNDVDDPRRHVDAHTLETLGELPEGMIPNPEGAPEEESAAVAEADAPEEELEGRLPIPFKGLLREYSAFYRFVVRRYDALLKSLGVRDPVSGDLRREYEAIDAKLSSYDTPEWQWLATQLEGFQLQSEEAGVPWILVLMPWQYQLQRSGEASPEILLKAYAQEKDLFYVDPVADLAGGNVSRLYIDMAHFSEEGHRLMGEVLNETLLESDLLPSR
jgi:lysophospholipase L1-like esterase